MTDHTFRDLNKNGRLDPYEDNRLPVEERVADLLGQMTLEEKAGLMFHTMLGMNPDGTLQDGMGGFGPIFTTQMVAEQKINHRYEEAGGVTALGVLSGGIDVGCTGVSIGPASYFFYSPIDYINWSPYRILTTNYRQQYYLHVFATGGTCTEYKTPIDANGNPIWAQQTSQSCQSAPGSGNVQSYNGFVTGQQWREGLWRDTSPNDTGWARAVPLNANGTINWGGANWSPCCSGTSPAAQDGYIVGNHYYLNVFSSTGSCVEYITPLNANGNPIWANQTSQACRTAAPGSGTVQSYNAFVSGQTLREGIWRGGLGYSRSVPLNATNTDVVWPNPPGSGWTQCCSGTAPAAQGGELTSHP